MSGVLAATLGGIILGAALIAAVIVWTFKDVWR